MADNWETIVKVKTVGDTEGAEKVSKSHEKIGQSAEKASRQSANAFKRMESALNGMRSAAARVNQALSSFTRFSLIVSGFESIVNIIGKLTGKSREAKKEAEELAKANQKAADAKAIEGLAKAYEKLSKAIANTNRERERGYELENMGLGNARDLEDKEAELAKIRAINALDPNDPDYEAKKAVIARRFDEAAANRDVARAREDNETEVKRLREQGFAKIEDAGLLRDSLRDDDREIAETKKRLKKAKDASTDPNEEDRSYIGHYRNVFSWNISNLVRGRTAAGDAVRKKNEQEAKELEGRLKELQAARDKKAEEAEQMKAEGEHLLKKADLVDDREKSIYETEHINAAKAEQPMIQRTAAYRAITEGAEGLTRLRRDKKYEEDRAKAAADAYAKEAGEAHDAQNRYDMLVANGGSRKDRSAALAALQKEQREAEEAKHEMERVAAEVANTLQGINAQIKALASAVKKAEGRLAQNQADAPEG